MRTFFTDFGQPKDVLSQRIQDLIESNDVRAIVDGFKNKEWNQTDAIYIAKLGKDEIINTMYEELFGCFAYEEVSKENVEYFLELTVNISCGYACDAQLDKFPYFLEKTGIQPAVVVAELFNGNHVTFANLKKILDITPLDDLKMVMEVIERLARWQPVSDDTNDLNSDNSVDLSNESTAPGMSI